MIDSTAITLPAEDHHTHTSSQETGTAAAKSPETDSRASEMLQQVKTLAVNLRT